MNRTLSFLMATFFFLSSCTEYVQIIYPEPKEAAVKVENGYYVFENDTVRVVYSFWGENGVLGFMIENKLKTPLFIDWQKSTLSSNQMTQSFYSEATNRKVMPRESASFFARMMKKDVSNKTPETHEKLVMIPASSYIMSTFEGMLDFGYIRIHDKMAKKTTLKNIEGMLVNMENTSQSFKTHIVYAADADFSRQASVSHEFFLKRIFIMDQKDFFYLDDKRVFQNTMQDSRCFYTKPIRKKHLYLKS